MTRQVRRQLVVFAVLTVLSMFFIARDYLQVPKLLGFNQNQVTVDFTDATGLYPGGLVTYRGVKVGKIGSLSLGPGQSARVTVNLDDDAGVPADSTARARSSSAIGENYIALTSTSTSGPVLSNGSTIEADRTGGILPTGVLLENLEAATASIPKGATDTLLTEVAAAFRGSDVAFGQLVTSANDFTRAANADIRSIESLFAQAVPFLGTQLEVAPDVKASLADLAAFTGTLDDSERNVNQVLEKTPALAGAATALVEDLDSDVPILLSNLLSVGQVVKVYLPGVEQILVIYPSVMSAIQTAATGDGAPGSIKLGARLTVNDPPNCYDGFLPIKDQRDFYDETRRADVPDDLYCKVPASDPRAVRGARNSPCFNAPGRRAASVEQCLGREIGTVDDPLGALRTTATYDPENGRVLAPDGQVMTVGGVGSTDQKGGASWTDLLVK